MIDFSIARVTASERGLWLVSIDGKDEFRAELTGKLRHSVANEGGVFPVVGDWVRVDWHTALEGKFALIHEIQPRRGVFKRSEVGSSAKTQVIAANVDAVLIVSSMNQDFNPRRLERFLVLAWDAGAEPVLVLTKNDLAVDTADEFVRRARAVAPGIAVISTTTQLEGGLDSLSTHLQPDKTYVLIGSSGVGKSSLVNALTSGTIATGGIRAADDRGRHTTTTRHLHRLANGASLIDSPGVREVGIAVDADSVERVFDGVEGIALQCRYTNCSHTSEDRCAILAALESGELSRERWESFQKLQREQAFRERQQSKVLQSAERKKWKTIAKHLKQKYKQR